MPTPALTAATRPPAVADRAIADLGPAPPRSGRSFADELRGRLHGGREKRRPARTGAEDARRPDRPRPDETEPRAERGDAPGVPPTVPRRPTAPGLATGCGIVRHCADRRGRRPPPDGRRERDAGGGPGGHGAHAGRCRRGRTGSDRPGRADRGPGSRSAGGTRHRSDRGSGVRPRSPRRRGAARPTRTRRVAIRHNPARPRVRTGRGRGAGRGPPRVDRPARRDRRDGRG